ncbi:hypothetical protein [Pseudooceanicola sp.]|uniref:hypothetical protein n=1 Tax=Pseudooceanicola sp. TaxID=1914328 RepID=UPI002601F6BE|nr:hypothetical protein [Pseudooceanicola sp.]MDF1856549.1 hypothetical protein [Pseudooceanicola sp.]
MSTSAMKFQDRVRNITRKAKAMEGGYHPRVRKDGLIEMQPDRPALRKRLPLKFLLALVASVIGYKTFLLIKIGEAGYNARIAALGDGETINQIGATIMKIDPLTRLLSDFIAPFFG